MVQEITQMQGSCHRALSGPSPAATSEQLQETDWKRKGKGVVLSAERVSLGNVARQ